MNDSHLFIIENIGDYHAPRLRKLQDDLNSLGEMLYIIQIQEKSDFYKHTQNRSAKITPFLTIETLTKNKFIRLASIIIKQKPKTIFVLGFEKWHSLLALALSKIIKSKIIFMSDSKADDYTRSAVKETLKRWLLLFFDGALVAGEKHKEYYKSLGVSPDKILTGYDVIDNGFFYRKSKKYLSKISMLSKIFNINPGYVLCVSRLVPRKRVDVAIEIFYKSEVWKNGTQLIIVGNGSQKKALEDKINTLGLNSHVVFLHDVRNDQMPLLYAYSKILILASEYDQWGLCVNEALACGVPVIVSDRCGAANEIAINFKNSFVFSEDLTLPSSFLNDFVNEKYNTAVFIQQSLSVINNWDLDKFSNALISLSRKRPHEDLQSHNN